jgi:hypothetical protein
MLRRYDEQMRSGPSALAAAVLEEVRRVLLLVPAEWVLLFDSVLGCRSTPTFIDKLLHNADLLVGFYPLQIPEQVLLFMQQNKYKPNNKDGAATTAAVS